MSISKLLVPFIMSLTLFGCSVGSDNVAACEAYVNSSDCGDTNASTIVNSCDSFADTECDVSEYFDCLAENVTCTDGVLDTTGAATCASKLSCN